MIELYTAATPNGQRVALMLELCGLAHEKHLLDLRAREHLDSPVARLNPAANVPVIVDHDGPGGEFVLSQSGAILLYLAGKTGRFLPAAEPARSETLQWFMHAVSDVGMLATSLFRTVFTGEADSASASAFRERLVKHLHVVDGRLADRPFLAGNLSVADIALYPTVASPSIGDVVYGLEGAEQLRRWMGAMAAMPETARALGR